MLRIAAIIIAALIVFSGVKPSSAADTRDIAFASTPIDTWIVTVKANAVAGPRWVGSDQFGFIAYPSMSFRRASEKPKFSSPDDGISIDGITMAGLSLSPVFRFKGGRSGKDHYELAGIHQTKWSIESGIQATYWIGENIRAKAEIRRGFRGKDGFEASFGADFVKSFGGWTVAVGPRLAIADASYMRYNFGVTAGDAMRNARVTEYKPAAGVKSVGAYASATYKFSESWATTVHGGYDRLVGNAAKSPIITKLGTTNQYMIGLTVAYSFPVKW